MTSFEKAGLGRSPFRLIDVVDRGRTDGTCSYCGHEIRYEFRIISADGHKSTIGSECIRSDWQPWAREAISSLATMKRAAKRRRLWDRAAVACQIVEECGQRYAMQPHPNEYFASQGRTYRDYLLYILGRPNRYAETTIKSFISMIEKELTEVRQ